MCLSSLLPVDRGDHPSASSRNFLPEPASCRAVRRFVRGVLSEAGIEAEVPELLVSELATNVIRYGQTPFTVRVSVGTVVRVEVQDGNAVVPTVHAESGDAEAGRGLFLVDTLADRWGVDERPGGKVVWFEYSSP